MRPRHHNPDCVLGFHVLGKGSKSRYKRAKGQNYNVERVTQSKKPGLNTRRSVHEAPPHDGVEQTGWTACNTTDNRMQMLCHSSSWQDRVHVVYSVKAPAAAECRMCRWIRAARRRQTPRASGRPDLAMSIECYTRNRKTRGTAEGH